MAKTQNPSNSKAKQEKSENSNTIVKEKNTKTKVPSIEKKIKKVHLPESELLSKMKNIHDQISELQGGENHKKRKRLYYKMAKLKKALDNPKVYFKDSNQEYDKANKDLERRITKKKSKKAFPLNTSSHSKKKSCLICKKLGHTLHECPESEFLQQDGVDRNLIICYNCGKTDHTLKNCKKKRKQTLPFAVCYVCKNSGHIARDCLDNEKGLYARGGGCYICDSVRHTASKCPKNPVNQLRRKPNKEVDKAQNPEMIEKEEKDSVDMDENKNIEELEPNFEDIE